MNSYVVRIVKAIIDTFKVSPLVMNKERRRKKVPRFNSNCGDQ